MKTSITIIIIALSSLYISCSSECRMKIEDFTVINKLDDSLWGWQNNSFNRYYLIRNFRNNTSCQSIMDSMACAFFSDTGIVQKNRSVRFFKKSRITNNEKMLENDRYLDRYSYDHDLLFSYGITLDSLGGSMGKSDYVANLKFKYSFVKTLDTLSINKYDRKTGTFLDLKQNEKNACFIHLVMPKKEKPY